MMELKEAYKGQLGDIGKGTAFIHCVTKISSKIVLTDPVQVCVRIEETEHDRMMEYCKDKRVKPISVMGMILQAAIKEFLDYDKSLEDAEKTRAEEAQEQAEKAHQEDLAREKEAKAKGRKLQKVPVDLKE